MGSLAKAAVLGLRLAIGLLLPLTLVWAQPRPPVVGPNINMVTGTRFPEGDPFLTKQSEPSLAVSSRNPRHLLGASNDYRQVPVFIAEEEDGPDAWTTLYKSVDGGTSWRGVVLGGCLLNIPACNDATGLTAQIKALAPEFAADPTVRAGPHGTFFYSFIAGIREVNSATNVVAVQRFVDKNNDIQRDTDVRRISVDGNDVDVLKHAEDPILPDQLKILDRGNTKRFIDKPWNAVDIGGRPWNTGTCDLLSWTKPGSAAAVAAGVSDASETVPAFSVYVAYSIFYGVVTAVDKHPQIAVVSSKDCGNTFSAPVLLSHEIHANQGASLAVDPLDGTVYVVWRSFGTEDDSPSDSEVDRIYMNKSTNGGATWLENPIVVATIHPYDQDATGNSFRTLGFPSATVSVDASGKSRLHVAYTSRNAGVDATPPYACQSSVAKDCDARLRIVTSGDGGRSWSAAVPVDPIPSTAANPDGRGHQVQPTLTFAAGKLAISWLDQRFDQTEEVLTCPAGATCTSVNDLVRTRQAMGNLDPNCNVNVDDPALASLAPSVKSLLGGPIPGACYEYRTGRPASVWTTYLTDGSPGLVRRHTIDVFSALADPADAPSFRSSVVSQYQFGSTRQDTKGNYSIRQKELFAPNLPLYARGTAAFVGDYIDIVGRSIVPTGDATQRYKYDVGAQCTSSACSKFTTTGTSPVFHVAFTDNRDVIPPADGDWSQPTCLTTEFTADPSNPITSFGACATPGLAGNRNQNIRTAIIAADSVAYAYSNSKLLSASAPRGFVITVENLGDDLAGRSYRLAVSPPSGVMASFDKGSFGADSPPPALTTLDVQVQPRSSATRSLWVQSSSPDARLVVQITSPPGCSGAGCYTTEVALNPDPGASQSLVGNGDGTAIDLANNDMGSVVLSNAVLTNNVLSNDAPVDAALSNAALSNNALTNAVLSNVVLSNAVLSNLQVENLNPVTSTLDAAALSNAVLTNAALSNVVLSNAVLSNSVLSNNALSNAVLSNETVQAAALSNAVLSNNALSNVALTNLDPANLALSNAVLSNNALSNVALSNNALSNVMLTNAALTNAALSNVVLSNAALSNNALSNNALSNVALSNVALSNSPLVDDLRTVEAANFDLGKNSFTSADLNASPFADGTFTIRNRGNTDTTLAVKLLLRDATMCDPVTGVCALPDGVKLQLVMRKIVPVPTAIPPTNPATDSGRAVRIGLTQFSAQVSNVGTPEVVSPDAPDLGSFLPNRPDAATLPLGPGERAYVTLRAIGSATGPSTVDPFEFLRWGSKFAVVDSAKTTRTAIPLIIKTLSLPAATALKAATYTISTAGGFGNVSADPPQCSDSFGAPATSGCLPGVALTFPSGGARNGTLSFTPAVSGTFYLVLSVNDQSVPPQNDRQLLKVVVNGADQTLSPIITSLVPATIEFGKPLTLRATGSSGAAAQFSISSNPSACSIAPFGTDGSYLLTPLNLGPCSVSAFVDGNAVYTALTVMQDVTVVQGSQTITFAKPADVVFGSGTTSLVASASSDLAVDFSTSSAGTICSVNGNTVTIVGGGDCVITASQAGNTNYKAAQSVTRTLTITPATQSITFNKPADVVFGSPTVSLSATASSGLAVSFATSSPITVCTVNGNSVSIAGGGDCVITASVASSANYSAATSVTRTLTITAAAQTISFAKPANVVVGSGPVTLSATASSLLPVSFGTSSSGTVCTVAGGIVTIFGGGDCVITATQGGNASYSAAAAVTQTLTITLKTQTISFNKPANVVVGSAPVALSATASSGLAVSFATTSPVSICTVSGSTATIVGGGDCVITASQDGNTIFSRATPVTQTLTITAKTQTIKATTPSNVTYSKSPLKTVSLQATASSGLAVTFSSTTPTVCTVSGNVATIVGPGTCTIAANQAGNASYSPAPQVTFSFKVNKSEQSISCDHISDTKLNTAQVTMKATASSGLPVSASSLTSSVCTISGGAIKLLAAGTCTYAADQGGDANFNPAARVQTSFKVLK